MAGVGLGLAAIMPLLIFMDGSGVLLAYAAACLPIALPIWWVVCRVTDN